MNIKGIFEIRDIEQDSVSNDVYKFFFFSRTYIDQEPKKSGALAFEKRL